MKIQSWFLIFPVIFLSACGTVSTILHRNIPKITDNQIFEADTIKTSNESFEFAQGDEVMLPDPSDWMVGKGSANGLTADEFLQENETTSFIVIKDDSIIYERFFGGYSRSNFSQVFSVTKSVTASLVSIAISEGYIKSVEQPVSDFLPYFDRKGRENIKLKHLLNMTSGLAFNDYGTFAKLLNLYYTRNQEQLIRNIKLKREPGTKFVYKSIATQVLGMCLEKAIGRRYSEYLEEKIWKPLGMEYEATLALDKSNGTAKMYGGLAISAIDLAKLGRLYLKNGFWNGKQIISPEWISQTTTADTTEGRSTAYSHCWWLDTYQRDVCKEDKDFFAGGFRGQIIYVSPSENTIIVRTGRRESGIRWPHAMSKLSLLLSMEEVPLKKAQPQLNTLEGMHLDDAE